MRTIDKHSIPRSLMSYEGGIPAIARNVWTKSELLEACRVMALHVNGASRFQYVNPAWIGVASFDELEALFHKGNPSAIPLSLVEDASRMVIDRMGLRAGISHEYAQAGDEPDVALYLSGEPECMANPVWHAEKPVVTIHAPLGYSAKIHHSAIIAHGIATSSAILALESAGYGVELIGWKLSHPMPSLVGGGRIADDTPTKKIPFKKGKDLAFDRGAVDSWRATGWAGGHVGIGIRMKEPDQTITAAELGFMLCHPAFLRGALLGIAQKGNLHGFGVTGFHPNEYPANRPEELAELSAEYSAATGATSRGVWLPPVQKDGYFDNPTAEQAAEATRKILVGMGFSE